MNETQPLDPSIVRLAQAISKTETGGSKNPYTTSGASGEYGAYQYTPATWAGDSQKYLGQSVPLEQATPAQQDEVAYNKIKDLGSQGYKPSQIASIWNSGKADPTGNVGINKYGVAYDTPGYVKKVEAHYNQLQQSSGGYNPQPYSHPDTNVGGIPSGTGTTGTDTPSTPSAPENLWQKAGDVASGIGNFLFPAVGDVSNLLQGKNTKTPLQIAGDVGLTALPFIPGLGEVAEAGRAGEAVAKGGGLLSKLAGLPTAVKGAGVGYGAGVASNLSQGQGLGQAVMPNAANIGGALLGGAAPIALGGLSSLSTKLSGIDPQIQTELAKMGSQANPEDANLYDKYVAATEAHASDLTAKSPLTIAADQLDKAALKLKNLYTAAGINVGEANRAGEAIPLAPEKIAPVATTFNNTLSDMFGIKVAVDDTGKLVLAPTRTGGVSLTPAEQGRILSIASRLNDFTGNGNVRMADDLMTELDKRVDYGTAQDPLRTLFKQTRGQLNGVAREASPAFAAANDKASGLASLIQEVKAMAGDKTQRGELLMRRVFSGDKSGDVQDLFGKIKTATGIDLTKHAVLARHAIQSFGSEADKTLLQKALEMSVTPHGGVGGFLTGLGMKAARSTFASPTRIGRNLVTGKTEGLLGNLITKGAARTGAAIGTQLQ